MRKLFVLSLAVWLALGVTAASADVFVFAEIDKFKDIVVTENVTVTKTIRITTTVNVAYNKAAESDALVNQTNARNHACTNCDEKGDLLTISGNGNSGVVTVNQAAGNMNNQGNAIAIAVDVVIPGGGGDPVPTPTQINDAFASAQASVEQNNGVIRSRGFVAGAPGVEFFEGVNTTTFAPNTVDTVNLLFRTALISGSLNANTGVVQANQSPGNMNNQANSLAVAVSLSGGVAMGEADLGQVNIGNSVFESDASANQTAVARVGINKRADILASINDNTGIVGVNQGAGNIGNQGNVVGAAATLRQ